MCNEIKVSKHKVSKFEVESTLVYENSVKNFFYGWIPPQIYIWLMKKLRKPIYVIKESLLYAQTFPLCFPLSLMLCSPTLLYAY